MLDHAGLGWPNGAVAGGNQNILRLPSPRLLMLSSEHWHVVEAQAAGKQVLFRGMARQGFRPAELNWNAKKYVEEITRDADRLPPGTIKEFVAWNELNLQDERGDHESDHGDLTTLYKKIGQFTYEVTAILRGKYPLARLHFGAFAPKDETDYVTYWQDAANACDVVDVHAYGAGLGIITHVQKYRDLFPNKPIELTEWHSYWVDEHGTPHQQADDDDTLYLLSKYSIPAYYFMWNWHNPPHSQRNLPAAINVEGNSTRLDLFQHPPVADELPPEPLPEPEPPMPPTFREFTPEEIAVATGCPLENVQSYWPKLVEQMKHAGIYEYEITLGLIGTVAIESASQFTAVEEAFWLNDADRWAEYVRRGYDGGPEFHGRGGIQHTHKFNYEKLGPKIAELWNTSPDQADFDLVTNPNNLLNPDFSAAADVIYFRDTATLQGYSLVQACRERDWEWVRRLVYGGRDFAGEARIQSIVNKLEGTDSRKVVFNPNEPTHLQEESFDCSQESLEWALHALGRKTAADDWIESTMIQEGVMTPEHGLMDGSGAGLADFINRHWGEFGFLANYETGVSYTFVALEGDHQYPLLIGGRAWNHWSGVRGYDAENDRLLLANPSPGHKGVGDFMTEQQFKDLGPFNMVRIWHPDILEAMPTEPPPTPLPEPPTEPTPEPPLLRTKEVIIAEIRLLLLELEMLP